MCIYVCKLTLAMPFERFGSTSYFDIYHIYVCKYVCINLPLPCHLKDFKPPLYSHCDSTTNASPPLDSLDELEVILPTPLSGRPEDQLHACVNVRQCMLKVILPTSATGSPEEPLHVCVYVCVCVCVCVCVGL